jgi:DNA-binding NarL/FixJ family response regulator
MTTICFIDDSVFEHDLVRNEIAPCDPDLVFVQAFTFEEAREKLGEKVHGLFLLDLWGKDEEVLKPYLSSKEELERRIAQFPTLDDVYKGLNDFEGDVSNEYLKRFFSIVDSWRTLFEEVCGKIGQNRKYGISNLQQVRKYYPGVPAVFYTRKSLINDAVAMLKAGTDGLFIKPTGANDAETRRLTREYAPHLLEELRRIMGARSLIE